MTATMNGKPKADVAEIRRAAAILFEPGQVVELRVPKAGRQRVISGYFDDLEKLSAAAAEVSALAPSTYWTINPADPSLLSRRANRWEGYASELTQDHQIARRRWLLVDVDPRRATGISASDDEHTAALNKARDIYRHLVGELAWPAPVVADSGNGGHLLFRVDLPADDDGLIQRVLAALDTRFSDDAVAVDTTVYNPSRIAKVYGTPSQKGDHTSDRPHRLARLLSVPDELLPVPVEALEAFAGPAAAPRQQGGSTRWSDYSGKIDLAEYLAKHGVEVACECDYSGKLGHGRKHVLAECVWCHERDKAAYVIQFDDGKLSAGCLHNRCKGRDWHAFRDAVEPGWRDRRQDWTGQAGPAPGPQPDTSSGGKRFEAYSLAGLMQADLTVEYLIDGILAAGQTAVLAGPQKSLKTSLLLDMALALSQGGYFLGRFKADQARRVGVLTGEIGYPAVRNTLIRVCQSRGVDPHGVTSLVIGDQVPMIRSLVDQDALRRFCMDHELEFLAVDPLYACLSADVQGNTPGQGQELRVFSDVCRDCGCTLLLCHHTKRESSRVYEPLDLSHLYGAGLPEFCRQWLLLSRRVPYVAGSGWHELHLVVGGSLGHESLWGLNIDEGKRDDPGGRRWDVEALPWEELRTTAKEDREARRQQRDQERTETDAKTICNVLAKYPDGETKRTIRDAAGMSGTRFAAALAYLLRTGAVVRCEVTKDNRKAGYEAYKLADE